MRGGAANVGVRKAKPLISPLTFWQMAASVVGVAVNEFWGPDHLIKKIPREIALSKLQHQAVDRQYFSPLAGDCYGGAYR